MLTSLCLLGWSMGAGQTFQWATQYPDFMDLVVPFCGAAKTSLHNQSMLEGVKVAVLSGKGVASAGVCKGAAEQGGYRAWSAEQREVGLKALGRVYSGWGFSQSFYREKLYEGLGFKDIESFMTDFWEAWALSKDPDNMIAMLYTWQAGDCSAQEPYNGMKRFSQLRRAVLIRLGDFAAAMKGIKAKALVLPCQTDLYFRKRQDSRAESEVR